jgi:putative membrane protein
MREPAGSQTGPAEAAPVAGVAEPGWHRMHWLTPALRSWQVLVVILVYVVQDLGQNAAQGQDPLDGDAPDIHLGGGVLAGAGAVLVLVLALGATLAVLSWRMSRYRVTADALELHTGVVFRRQRRARLDRLQAVDVVQPFIARIVGLAKLKVEVAGGNDSQIQLSYLTESDAQRLRNVLLARAAGVHFDDGQEAPQAPEHEVLQVPVQRLVLSLLATPATIVALLALVGFVTGGVLAGSIGPVGFAVPVVVGLGSMLWARFTGGFAFRAATSPDGLRLRHGLLEQRAQTVPPGRVQAVRLQQPLLWRPADWWQVRVNIAGYGGGNRELEAETTLLPVGRRDEAVAVLALVLPEMDEVDGLHPRAVVDAGLVGAGDAGGFVGSPRRARWLDPLSWRRNAFRVTGQALLLRSGRLRRQLDVVPHARTQSIGVRQGPLERRLGLASFALHSTPGPIQPVMRHLASATAAALLAEQAVRARQARASAGPERWMEVRAVEAAQDLSGEPIGSAVEPVPDQPGPTSPDR